MDEQQIRTIAMQVFQEMMSRSQFMTTPVPYHTHNGIDSFNLSQPTSATTAIFNTSGTPSGGGGGTTTTAKPGGNNSDIQFNNSGGFGGDDNFAWDVTNKILTLNNSSGDGVARIQSGILPPGSFRPGQSTDLQLQTQSANPAPGEEESGAILLVTANVAGGSSVNESGDIQINCGDSPGLSIVTDRGGSVFLNGGLGPNELLQGNVSINTVVYLFNPTDASSGGVTGTMKNPTTSTSDVVKLYSTDVSAGNTIPSFWCEGTGVLATGQADSPSSTRVKMRINGTVVTLLAI